ncbi:MAG: acetoacetate--CoA ligase [Marivivens sp.]|nr:acetoacetate--CoA ligase [Marivivens sp.]
MSDIIWTPSEDQIETSAMARFARENGFDPKDYDSLHRWSVSDLAGFWGAVWDFAGVVGERGETVFRPDPAHWMTGAAFFPGARVNLAENMMRALPQEAVVETDETGHRRAVSADALRGEVARVADGLKAAGIVPGDRVGVVLPNRLEALVTLLATLAVGGVWTSCSPDFGAAAIHDRIGQVAPKVLIAQARFRYGGKDFDISERITELAARIDGLGHLVLVGEGAVTADAPVTGYEAFGTEGAALEFTRVAFDDPCYVLYTSGTTGQPKAIVHRTGGVILKHAVEHILHADVRRGDRVSWYTNTAWMMYHWIVSGLGAGATVVLYDGAPILKNADGSLDGTPLWRMLEAEQLTHLGISPKYLATLQDAGFVPQQAFDTTSLRWLMAAGSPMAPYQYDWMYEAISGTMGFASISGGSEILGCFLLGSPLHPVRRGTLTVRGLGMAANIFDARNAPVIGRSGDLVCTEPFPSMPKTFWGENGDTRYHNTYFADRPEVWTHGDHATLNADGSAVIHGRSDCTLNPGGVRIGTADIYNVCERFEAIEDCIVFGRPVPGDEEIVLCIKPAAGQEVDAGLAKAIRSALRAECSPRHAPAAIYTVADIPYTLNNKRVEGAARSMVVGEEVKNKASLGNAACLDEYGELNGRVAL